MLRKLKWDVFILTCIIRDIIIIRLFFLRETAGDEGSYLIFVEKKSKYTVQAGR
jgi:hypothetical protein